MAVYGLVSTALGSGRLLPASTRYHISPAPTVRRRVLPAWTVRAAFSAGEEETSSVDQAATSHGPASRHLTKITHLRSFPGTLLPATSSRFSPQGLPSLQRPLTVCHVSAKDENAGDKGSDRGGSDLTENLLSLGILAFWAAWGAYSFTLSPNQTPTIDKYYLEKLCGLRADDGFVVNSVVFSLWNLMGLIPVLYSMLLIPASRTKRNIVPAWPFVAVSPFLGAFVLLPYFAIWKSGEPCIPTEEERKKLSSRIFESKITSAAVLLGVVSLVVSAASAPPIDWTEFGQIVRQSRLFHITTSDFIVLTLSAPFWMYNDMAYRDWKPRDSWGLGLLLVPLVGPFIYTVLRPELPAPNTEDSSRDS